MHKFKGKDIADLKSFLFRLLNPWKGQGRSQNNAAMSGGAAEAFGNLLRNMNIIAKEVVANAHERSPTIDFSLDPWVKPKRVQKNTKENPKEDSISVSIADAKDGGVLYVSGNSRLTDVTGRCYVEFGIGLETRSRDRNFYPFTYAQIGGGAFRTGEPVYVEKDATARILFDKPRAVTQLRKRIAEAIEEIVTRGSPRSQMTKLKKFRKALR